MHTTLLRTSAVLVAVAVGQAVPAQQPAVTPTQPAREPTAPALMPAGYPPGLSDASAYREHLQGRLVQLQKQIDRLGDQQAKAQACLDLVAFSLVRGVEPALSWAWLGLPQQRDQALAERMLDAARKALAQADSIRLGQAEAEGGVEQLAAEIDRYGALADMQAALLNADARAALEAARKADSLIEQVPDPARPTWNLLIADCLDRAGKDRDALLRIQPVLRQHPRAAAGLAGVILHCRILAEAGNHAAAVALATEYQQNSPPAQTQPATATGRADNAGPPPADPNVASCTLALIQANLLRDWAAGIAGSPGHEADQTIAKLRRQEASMREQPHQAGPCLLRLLPLLAPLERPAAD